MLRFVPLALVAALAGLAPGARAATFQAGDLYLMSHSLPATGGGSLYGIVRVAPLSGTTTLLYTHAGTLNGAFTYDPYRERLICVSGGDGRVLAVDADGVATTIYTAPAGQSPQVVAARGDGILYLQVGAVFYYLDAANTRHPLQNEAGTGAYNLLPSGALSEMRYHAGTNSLITSSSVTTLAACPDPSQACAGKIPLTPAGTQVAGPMTGSQLNISDSSEQPIGSGERSDGKVVLIYDNNENLTHPRMLLFDPATMALGAFAWSGGYPGAAALSTGTYSNVRGQAVLDDSFNDVLRGYSPGNVGAGDVFSTAATGYGVSSTGGHSEVARMAEIVEPAATSVPPGAGTAGFELLPPSPNPSRGEVAIRFRLAVPARVGAGVYDVRGRLVRGMGAAERGAGWHAVSWDGTDDRGALTPAGIYFVRLGPSGATREVRVIRIR